MTVCQEINDTLVHVHETSLHQKLHGDVDGPQTDNKVHPCDWPDCVRAGGQNKIKKEKEEKKKKKKKKQKRKKKTEKKKMKKKRKKNKGNRKKKKKKKKYMYQSFSETN